MSIVKYAQMLSTGPLEVKAKSAVISPPVRGLHSGSRFQRVWELSLL